MQKTIIFLLSLLVYLDTIAQVKWADGQIPFNNIEWNNYSTSFIGGGNNETMLGIVTAIPYNGVYSFGDADERNSLDMTFSGAAFRFKSNLSDKVQKLYTYDSSEVFFLVPGIYPNNANQFEYRILLNGEKEVRPWSAVIQFSDVKFSLNNFKKGFAYLGGYKTTWGNFLVVDVRKKGSEKSVYTSAVYWKQVKPNIAAVYTTDEFNELFNRLKGSYNNIKEDQLTQKPKTYSADHKKLLLKPEENNLIFYLSSNIYKKEAIEYELQKNGEPNIEWKANDYDNNLIWLKNLGPGDYQLRIRFKGQRQNVTEYPFEIKPAWQQTTSFKIISGSLIAAFFGFIMLLFRTAKQKRLLKQEQSQKEQTEIDLKQLRSQLNPHFIFNALSSIQGLVNNNDNESANQYLSQFSSLLRDSLKNNDKDFTPLQQELKILETYIQLEQLRFGFTYTISVIEQLNTSEIELPSLLIQPLIENAIKHGISALKGKGKLVVDFYANGKDFCIKIADNGKGFTATTDEGFGLKLTRDRIRLLNQRNKNQQIQFTIESNNGTIANINFQNWLA